MKRILLFLVLLCAVPLSAQQAPIRADTAACSPRGPVTNIKRDGDGRILRSRSARNAFERQTGHPKGWAGHVVDHVIALACGGLDAPVNMQWQTVAQGKAKDKSELKCCPPPPRGA